MHFSRQMGGGPAVSQVCTKSDGFTIITYNILCQLTKTTNNYIFFTLGAI